jgi:outer membrane protein assembly factor BamB
MKIPRNSEHLGRKPLRLWPGVVAVVLQWLAWLVVPLVDPGMGPYGVMGGLIGGLLILVWWLLFSRARWLERLGAVALLIVAPAATLRLVHISIANGMMGFMLFAYVIPFLCLALVAWAVACRRMAGRTRHALMVAAILLACVPMMLVRSEGVTGEYAAQFAWRWSETPEERLLAQPLEKMVAPQPAVAKTPIRQPSADIGKQPTLIPPASPEAKIEAEWPGFRGADRDGVIHGVRINTDWSASPPVQLWKRPVGPGWSSFAVQGDLLFTQEQRGDSEIVACYKVTTGEPVWKHGDAARFWESNAGAGPRATPTLASGRVYTFGATGILNALNARDGSVAWTRNVASDIGVEIPIWGFASSPLVVNDLVVVAAAGTLAACDLATGKQRWSGPAGGSGYSSPQLAKIDGVEQVLLLNGAGGIGVSPADGKLLWEHAWKSDGIVQPALTAEGDVLIGTGSGIGSGSGMGVRRIAVTHEAGGWTAAERWTSAGLKPYYNDFVVHKGFAYGFDGSILACIDLKDGNRKWKGGRYGHGQIVLLPDQDVLLVLSEEGELALVGANPDHFAELARIPAIEGKTWNHPVLAGNILLVRNSQEMAAFRLALTEGARSPRH